MPGNIEAGVILSTTDSQLQKEWQSRFPYQLPKKPLGADSDYVPAFPRDVRNVCGPPPLEKISSLK